MEIDQKYLVKVIHQKPNMNCGSYNIKKNGFALIYSSSDAADVKKLVLPSDNIAVHSQGYSPARGRGFCGAPFLP